MLADGVLCYLTNDVNFLYSISRITIFFRMFAYIF